jgi:hypothetical protein
MFERLRTLFASDPVPVAETGVATPAQLAQWAAAQGWALAFQGEPAQFQVGGVVVGQSWRIESGLPTRDYVQGAELRARADMRIAPEIAIMVISRQLKEELEGRVYGAITETMRTAVDDSLPQEMRWLSMYEELRWPELPASFSRLFAVVGDRVDHAQHWVNAAVVSHLLMERAQAARALAPLLLMLADGRMSLRMQTTPCHQPDLQYAAALFTAAVAVAAQNLPPPPHSQPDTLPPG